MGIDDCEMELLFDRIDHAGKPVTIFIDAAGKLRARIVTPQFRNHPPKGCKIVGVYDIGANYRDLKADVEYVRAM